jgi:hypothetical protein
MGRRDQKPEDAYIFSKPAFKVKASKRGLLQGLHLLKWLWNRSLKPKDLKKHFFLTWFAFTNGNASRQASRIGLHRNTLLSTFREQRGTAKTLKMRFLWKKIQTSFPKNSFQKQFFPFYKKAARIPAFTRSESKDLVNLWLTGFPFKALRPHYVLWAFRNGFTQEKIGKMLGVSTRTIHRVRYSNVRKGSAAAKWLSSLKPKKKDWNY